MCVEPGASLALTHLTLVAGRARHLALAAVLRVLEHVDADAVAQRLARAAHALARVAHLVGRARLIAAAAVLLAVLRVGAVVGAPHGAGLAPVGALAVDAQLVVLAGDRAIAAVILVAREVGAGAVADRDVL